MSTHPIENIMKTTMEQITEMIDVNTIVGDAVEASDGSLIIPVSKVSFGFVSGGAEYGGNNNSQDKQLMADTEQAAPDLPFGGGTGAGVSIDPMAFLVIQNGQVKLLPVEPGSIYGQMVNAIPQVLTDIKEVFTKDSSNENVYCKC